MSLLKLTHPDAPKVTVTVEEADAGTYLSQGWQEKGSKGDDDAAKK